MRCSPRHRSRCWRIALVLRRPQPRALLRHRLGARERRPARLGDDVPRGRSVRHPGLRGRAGAAGRRVAPATARRGSRRGLRRRTHRLLGYAALQDSQNGHFGLTQGSGWFTYARAAPFADCRLFTPPTGTDGRRDARDARLRFGSDWYAWSPRSPAQRLFGGPPNHSALVGAFGRAAIEAQPRAYVHAVAVDLLGATSIPTPGNQPELRRRGADAARPRSRASPVSRDGQPHGGRAALRECRHPHGRCDRWHARGHPARGARARGSPCSRQSCWRSPAPQLARGRDRAVILLLAGTALAPIILATATTIYNWRYAVPLLPSLAAAGAFGAHVLASRIAGIAAPGERSAAPGRGYPRPPWERRRPRLAPSKPARPRDAGRCRCATRWRSCSSPAPSCGSPRWCSRRRPSTTTSAATRSGTCASSPRASRASSAIPACTAGYPAFLDGLQAIWSQLRVHDRPAARARGCAHRGAAVRHDDARRARPARRRARARRRGRRSGGDFIFLEHALLTETLWSALLAASLYCAVRALSERRLVEMAGRRGGDPGRCRPRPATSRCCLPVVLVAVDPAGVRCPARAAGLLCDRSTGAALHRRRSPPSSARRTPPAAARASPTSAASTSRRVAQFADSWRVRRHKHRHAGAVRAYAGGRAGRPVLLPVVAGVPDAQGGYFDDAEDAEVLGRFAREALLAPPLDFAKVVGKDVMAPGRPTQTEPAVVRMGTRRDVFGDTVPARQSASREQIAAATRRCTTGSRRPCPARAASRCWRSTRSLFRVPTILLLARLLLSAAGSCSAPGTCSRSRFCCWHRPLPLRRIRCAELLRVPLRGYPLRAGDGRRRTRRLGRAAVAARESGAVTAPRLRGVSEALREFVAEMPWEREVDPRLRGPRGARAAAGARVLDVGAGDAPYRELFDHAEYLTTRLGAVACTRAPGRRTSSPRPTRCRSPTRASTPCCCTQVLEHVPEPGARARRAGPRAAPGRPAVPDRAAGLGAARAAARLLPLHAAGPRAPAARRPASPSRRAWPATTASPRSRS